jgi:hypothetical protein
MRKSLNRGAARRETNPAAAPVKVLRRNPGKNHGRAHLYLVVGGPARPFKDTRARDIHPVTTQIGDEQEVTVWVLLLVLGLSILMAAYILSAKTSGFACRTSPTNVRRLSWWPSASRQTGRVSFWPWDSDELKPQHTGDC